MPQHFRRGSDGHVNTHTGEYDGPHSAVLTQNSRTIPFPEHADALLEATTALRTLHRKLARQTHSGSIIDVRMLARRCTRERPVPPLITVTIEHVRAAKLYLGTAVVGPRDRNPGTSFIL